MQNVWNNYSLLYIHIFIYKTCHDEKKMLVSSKHEGKKVKYSSKPERSKEGKVTWNSADINIKKATS